MDFMIVIILSIVAGILIATIAASGIYYAYRTKKDKAGSPAAKKGGGKKKERKTETDSYVVYQDESRMGLESHPVQPRHVRPIMSPDDVYPPVREDEEQDDFLLQSLDMDYTSTGTMPPDEMVERRGSLEFLLHFYQLSSTLTLTMVRMSDLPRRLDTNRPPDPIIELELKYSHEGKVKSETYQNTCNPHMYESFRFEVPVNDLGNQTLCFRVIDLMQTGIPEWIPPTPPPPPKGRRRQKDIPPPPEPPPPPPPTLIGNVTVPLASVPMKKLLSDTEITIVRDIIKLRRKRPTDTSTPIVMATGESGGATSGGEAGLSTTGTSEFEDAIDTVDTADETFVDSECSDRVTVEGSEKGDEDRDKVTEALVAIPARPPVSFATDELGQEGQMVLISLAYWKPSEKLTVVVMKGKNLRPIDKNRKPDPFVKLYIMMGAKRLKKKRTLSKKRDGNPVWNEAFSFNIPHRILHRVSVMLLAKHHSERGRERFLGKLVIGANSTDEAVDHWNAMSTSGKSVARWHHLVEEK